METAADSPQPMHLCGYWYALPTDDQTAVLGAFDLSDAEPVMMRVGESAWNHDSHNWYSHEPHARCRRMFVSPVLDAWTLVFGSMPTVAHAQELDPEGQQWTQLMFASLRALSRRFGEAHWYGMSCGDDWTSWCVARDGEIVRYYDAFQPEYAVGEPLPQELRCEGWASDLAGELSVNPEALGSETDMRGQGVLALTACGRAHGIPEALRT